MLQLNFLGVPVVRHQGQPLPELTGSPILISLLAYLVLHRERPHSRSVLATLFWPESSESRARRNLNSHLYRLRSLLPARDYILSDRETVEFSPQSAFWLDVNEFETLTAHLTSPTDVTPSTETQALESAVALYHADFLDGVYDDWIQSPRERLRERYLLTLNKLVEVFQGNGRFDSAIRAAKRWLQADPFCEMAH